MPEHGGHSRGKSGPRGWQWGIGKHHVFELFFGMMSAKSF